MLLNEFRHGLRSLARSPGFALATVLTLALGIGATTTIFSVVDGVLLRPLGFPQPERLVRLFEVDADGRRMNFSDPNFDDVVAGGRRLLGPGPDGAGQPGVGVGWRRALPGAIELRFPGVLCRAGSRAGPWPRLRRRGAAARADRRPWW